MKRRKLLQNGTEVSEVGLGCMSFAGFYGATSEAEALRTLCLLYTSPSPRDVEESRMPASA